MSKLIISGVLGFGVGFFTRGMLVAVLQREAVNGDEEARRIMDQYTEAGEFIHSILR